MVSAIILTGGEGVRLQRMGIPKQFIEVAGKPLFVHCMETYESIKEIDEIVLVINEKCAQRYDEIIQKHRFNKLRAIASGGKFRHDSIQNGLACVKHSGVVVIQNGVNPATPADLVQKCIEAAFESGAATAYVPAFHTVFVGAGTEVETVLERKRLGYTCDPQAFRVDVIREALDSAAQGTQGDLAAVDLVRRLGRIVKMVISDERNIKVSTAIDLFVVEHILSKMNAGNGIGNTSR